MTSRKPKVFAATSLIFCFGCHATFPVLATQTQILSTRKRVQSIEQYSLATVAQNSSTPLASQCDQLSKRVNQIQVIASRFSAEIDAFTQQASSAQTLEDIKSAASRYANATNSTADELNRLIQPIQSLGIVDPQLSVLRNYYSNNIQATTIALKNASDATQSIVDVASIEELESAYTVFSEKFISINSDFSALDEAEKQIISSVNEICLANAPENIDISDFINSFPNSRGFITANRLLSTYTFEPSESLDSTTTSRASEQQPEQTAPGVGYDEGQNDFQRVRMGAQQVYLFQTYTNGEVDSQHIRFGEIYSRTQRDNPRPYLPLTNIEADYTNLLTVGDSRRIFNRPQGEPDDIEFYRDWGPGCGRKAVVDLSWASEPNSSGSRHLVHWERWEVSCHIPQEEAVAAILSLTNNGASVEKPKCEEYGLDNNDIHSSQYWVRQACLSFAAENIEQGALALTIAYEEALKEDQQNQLQVNLKDFSVALNKTNNELFITQTEPEQSNAAQVTLQAASLLVGFIPVIGTATDWVNAITGVDQITGEKLEWWERVLSLAPYGRRVGQLTQVAVDKIDNVTSGVRHRLNDFFADESGTVTIPLGRGGWTRAAARQRAQELGFDPVSPGSLPKVLQTGTQGAPVFRGRLPDTNRRVYISPDVGGHGIHRNPEPAWKVFDQRGEQIGTYSNDLRIWIRE